MMVGAKILLSAELDTVREGLAGLSDTCWLMSLPLRQDAHHGHPAGSARPGLPASGSEPRLVAVTFGTRPAGPGSCGALAVHWEPVEARDALGVLLAGNITPAAAERGGSSLTLGGFCRLLPAADSSREQARLDAVKEAARSFITSVAMAIVPASEPSPGTAWAWLTGQRPAG